MKAFAAVAAIIVASCLAFLALRIPKVFSVARSEEHKVNVILYVQRDLNLSTLQLLCSVTDDHGDEVSRTVLVSGRDSLQEIRQAYARIEIIGDFAEFRGTKMGYPIEVRRVRLNSP